MRTTSRWLTVFVAIALIMVSDTAASSREASEVVDGTVSVGLSEIRRVGILAPPSEQLGTNTTGPPPVNGSHTLVATPAAGIAAASGGSSTGDGFGPPIEGDDLHIARMLADCVDLGETVRDLEPGRPACSNDPIPPSPGPADPPAGVPAPPTNASEPNPGNDTGGPRGSSATGKPAVTLGQPETRNESLGNDESVESHEPATKLSGEPDDGADPKSDPGPVAIVVQGISADHKPETSATVAWWDPSPITYAALVIAAMQVSRWLLALVLAGVRRTNGARKRVLLAIKAQPGIHLKQLARELDMGTGILRHHLQVLGREGQVYQANVRNYSCFFADPYEKKALCEGIRAVKAAPARRLLEVLASCPGQTVGSLARAAGVPSASAYYHVRHLVDAGLVRVSPGDGHARKLTAEPSALMVLDALPS